MTPAGRTHVLRLQGREDRLEVQAQAGEPLDRELDVDLLVLRAQHLDLRDVGHLQQPRARRLDVVAQLAEVEAVGGEAVDDAEGVAEVVVEERPDHAGGQRLAHVADIATDLVPDVGNLRRRRRLLEFHEQRGLTGRRVAADAVEETGLLDGPLEPLGDLFNRFFDRRAGPGAPTTMVRVVKTGSSARPRLRNDAVPAARARIIRK